MNLKSVESTISRFNSSFTETFKKYENIKSLTDFRQLFNELFPITYCHLNERKKELAEGWILKDEISQWLYDNNLPLPNKTTKFLPTKFKTMEKERILYYILDILKTICQNKDITKLYTIFPEYTKKNMEIDFIGQQVANKLL